MANGKPNPQKNRELVLFVLGVILGGAVGAAVARVPNAPVLAPAANEGSYEEGYKDAKRKLEELRVLTPEPESMNEVVGNIIDVGENSFVLQVDPTTVNPLVKDVPMQREILVTEATVITRKDMRDPEEYAKEMEAYEKAFAEAVEAGGGSGDAPAPSRYVDKVIVFKDLVQGNRVTVDAGKDVKGETRITALRVTVGFSAPAAPAIAPPPPPPEPSPR